MTFDEMMKLLDVVPEPLRKALVVSWGSWGIFTAVVGIIALLRTEAARGFCAGVLAQARSMLVRLRALTHSPIEHPKLKRLAGSVLIVVFYYFSFDLFALMVLIAGLWAQSLLPTSQAHLTSFQHAKVIGMLIVLPVLAAALKAEADREWLRLRTM